MIQDWPNPSDDGRRVEIKWLDTNDTTEGILVIEDWGHDDNGEFPIWYVQHDDGSKRSFADQSTWRFV